MRVTKSFEAWITRRFARLYSESLLSQFTIVRKIRVKADKRRLTNEPFTTMMLNQRALLLASGGIFLAILLGITLASSVDHEMLPAVAVLLVGWTLDVIITLVLIRSLRFTRPTATSSDVRPNPPAFYAFFVLDFFLLTSVVLAGRLMALPLDAFTFLLLGNTIMFVAYTQSVGRVNGRIISIILLQLLFVAALLTLIRPTFGQAGLFYWLITIGPIIGMAAATLFVLLTVAWLRNTEHYLNLSRLRLLGESETILQSMDLTLFDLEDRPRMEQQVQARISKVLDHLCSQGPPFWYASAKLWFVETHQDRGRMLLLGPTSHIHRDIGELITSADSLDLTFNELILVPLKSSDASDGLIADPDIKVGAPATFIPLAVEGITVGLLALSGGEKSPPIFRQEEAFLHSLGSIISNFLIQTRDRAELVPQTEIDDLFKCEQLIEVFQRVATIAKRYLAAEGCMVVFRPNPYESAMHIIAKDGFSDVIYRRNLYTVGRGLTGKCAQTGKTIRIDDVSLHKEVFDADLLDGLERSLGKPISSWMAIPIGNRDRNYGVVKVVNRTYQCNWFREEDERLGESLALRLLNIIEKFLYIEQLEHATSEARTQSEEASKQSMLALQAQNEAEQTARTRQEDLMSITHQLQAPLTTILGTISNLKRLRISQDITDSLERLEEFVEDSIFLCYGTFTTFALDAGRSLSLNVQDIDATVELRKLCSRMQRTQFRNDLHISYSEHDDFPKLRVDRDIFTSVLYSLLHNAMKYADQNSEIGIKCRVFGSEALITVESLGQPIQPEEVQDIFEKFRRGRVIEKTGRYHSGVGLGLWIAKRLIKTVDGDLRVELNPDNPRLSSFIISLPLTDGERCPTKEQRRIGGS